MPRSALAVALVRLSVARFLERLAAMLRQFGIDKQEFQLMQSACLGGPRQGGLTAPHPSIFRNSRKTAPKHSKSS